MNPRLIMTLAGALLLCAAGAAGFWHVTRDSGMTTADDFPDRLPVRVEFHRGEVVRNVELWPDLTTPKHSIADHPDGSITNYWYRSDGTLEKAITEGPLDESGSRHVLRIAEIDKDGVTYRTDVEFFPAGGGKSKEVTQVDANTLNRLYFFANGLTRKEQTVRRETKGWLLVFENVFREDRTLASSFRTLENGASERKEYSAEGLLSLVKSLGPWGTSYKETVYASDGVAVLKLMEQNSSKTEVTDFRADGTTDIKRTWNGEVGKSSLVVQIYDRQGKLLYDQWWSWKADPASDKDNKGKYVLWLHKEFRPDGTLARTIYFDDTKGTGEFTEIVWEGDGNNNEPFVRRYFRGDGTLKTEEVVARGNNVTATREYSVEDNVRITNLPAERIAFRPFTAPPQVIAYVPQMHP